MSHLLGNVRDRLCQLMTDGSSLDGRKLGRRGTACGKRGRGEGACDADVLLVFLIGCLGHLASVSLCFSLSFYFTLCNLSFISLYMYLYLSISPRLPPSFFLPFLSRILRLPFLKI